MSFLVTDSDVRYINASTVSISDSLPVGIYKACFSEQIGSYLEKTDISTSHGKIYGDSEMIASHIVDSYKRKTGDKNIGVLLSGGKGLGKSLTAKLVVEKLRNELPVIIVSDFFPALPDFLSNISNSIIFFDEFEKTTSGRDEQNGSRSNKQTAQEKLLSVFDGASNSKNNLFLLTVNSTGLINENLISRPGRIKYHYRFENSSADMIRNYCEDNLKRKELIGDITDTLLSTRFVSMDIISSLVDELNMFDDLTVEKAMRYLNVDGGSATLTFRVRVMFRDKEYMLTSERRNVPLSMPKVTIEFGCDTNIKMDEYETLWLSFSTYVAMNKFRIPLVGWLDITKYVRLIENGGYSNEVKILKVEAKESEGKF